MKCKEMQRNAKKMNIRERLSVAAGKSKWNALKMLGKRLGRTKRLSSRHETISIGLHGFSCIKRFLIGVCEFQWPQRTINEQNEAP
jgi:hypothetical protein